MLKDNKYKVLLSLIMLLSFCLAIIITPIAQAATCGGAETSLISCDEGGDGGIYHILNLVIDIFSIGVGILAVIGITWAGIEYLTAGSDITKTTKAKKRIYETTLGIVAYVILWAFSQWLLPGSRFNPTANTSLSISISSPNEATVDETFKPNVQFNQDTTDKTYSLISGDTSILQALGNSAKCTEAGRVTLTAIASNGAKASREITCNEKPSTSNGSSSSSPSNSSSSSTTATVGSQSNTEMKAEKPKARKATRDIIKEHESDFFHVGKKSYKKVVLGANSQYGSYKNYVKSLGGIFTQYADTKRIKVTTAADLQAAAEYVFGLWSIWGPDYSGWFRTKWKGSDAFYENDPNRNSYPYVATHSINTVLSNSDSNTIDTHCNKSVHVFMASTTLKSINTGAGKSNIKNKLSQKGYYSDKLITKISDLQVGDLVNFESCTPPAGHVTIVGEVYKDYLVFYDGGSRFMQNNNYKFKVKRNAKTFRGSTYSGYCSWYGYRPWKINQTITLGGLN